MTSNSDSQFEDQGFTVGDSANKSRQDHLYDDLDLTPESHHHSVGEGPNQAVSLPIAKARFDARYATLNHSHVELAGDNLIYNGDAALGDTGWVRTGTAAVGIIDAEKFISQLNTNPSSIIWRSTPFAPTPNELVAGAINFQGNQTSVALEVSVLYNSTGATPEIGDGISTTVVLATDTIDVINTNATRAFSWLVPSCSVARLFIKWDNGSVTSGFPITITHDNVQLITKLGTVSPLYVGVKDPQEMEGPLTITADNPLELQTTNVGLGKVLTDTDGAGTADWVPLPGSVKYIQDTEPTAPLTGDQWSDTSIVDVDDFYFDIVSTAVSPYNAITAPSTVDGTFHDITGYDTFTVEVPCEGLLILDWQCLARVTTANSVIIFIVAAITDTNCTATDLTAAIGLSQSRGNAVNTSSEQTLNGGNRWLITAVGAEGGTVEFQMQAALSTAASGGVRYPYVRGHFIPYGNERHIKLELT
jgi:hypothetical protein